jgi:hypothetical protein
MMAKGIMHINVSGIAEVKAEIERLTAERDQSELLYQSLGLVSAQQDEELTDLRARLATAEQALARLDTAGHRFWGDEANEQRKRAEAAEQALAEAERERDEAERERNEAWTQLEGAKKVGWELQAENRALVGIIEDMDGLAYGFDTTELVPLTAVEVARVKGLEAALERWEQRWFDHVHPAAVEARVASLEADNAALREALREAVCWNWQSGTIPQGIVEKISALAALAPKVEEGEK